MNCDTFCCKNWLATAKLYQKSIYHFQLLFDDKEDGHKQYCTQQQIALFSNCYFDWNANINHSIENNLPSWTIIMYCSTSCHHHHISIIFQFYPLYLKVIQRQAPWVLIVENPNGAAILRPVMAITPHQFGFLGFLFDDSAEVKWEDSKFVCIL